MGARRHNNQSLYRENSIKRQLIGAKLSHLYILYKL
jgi:hypothetical protein